MSDFDFSKCPHCKETLPDTAVEERVACPSCGRRLSTEHPGGMTLAGGFHIRQMAPGTSRRETQKAREAAPKSAPPPPKAAPPPTRSEPPPARTAPINAEIDAPPLPAEPAAEAPPAASGKPNLRLKREADQAPMQGPWYIKFVKKSLFGTKEREEGPFSYDELRCLIRDKTVTTTTQVRREEESSWQAAGAYDALFKAR